MNSDPIPSSRPVAPSAKPLRLWRKRRRKGMPTWMEAGVHPTLLKMFKLMDEYSQTPLGIPNDDQCKEIERLVPELEALMKEREEHCRKGKRDSR